MAVELSEKVVDAAIEVGKFVFYGAIGVVLIKTLVGGNLIQFLQAML